MNKTAISIAAILAVLGATVSCDLPRKGAPAPVFDIGNRYSAPRGGGEVNVERGDTVWSISERYRLPLRDIIDLNQLSPPYDLARLQRLRLPPPREHVVGEKDTLYSLSRLYGVSVSQLVRVNKIPAPYFLKPGQVVRLPAREYAAVNAPVQERRMPGQDGRPHALRDGFMPRQYEKKKESLPPAPVINTEPVARAQPFQPSGKFSPVWPVRGRMISSYGPKANAMYNDGINIAAPKGTPVVAAEDGQVVYADDGLAGYGNLVLIRHQGGVVTAYAHMANITAAKGQIVRRGQMIGTVGSTGKVTGAQLHFEVRKGKDTVNPLNYL